MAETTKILSFFVTTNDGEGMGAGFSKGSAVFNYANYNIESLSGNSINFNAITPYNEKTDADFHYDNDLGLITINIYSPLHLTTFNIPVTLIGVFNTTPQTPEYKGSHNGNILGIGDASFRLNEITGDNLAVFRNFIFGYKDGVIKFTNHDFNYSVNKTIVNISDGMCFAYGYLGYCQAKRFDILPPAVESYFVIYAVIDKSVIPNTVELKIKNNYASPNIGINTFRQDILSIVKTGAYEIPLWIFRATNKGIDELSFDDGDIRPLRNYPQKSEYSDYTNVVLAGKLDEGEYNLQDGVTAATQPISNNTLKIATTEFTNTAIQAEINK